MQQQPLQISAILRFGAEAHGEREIVSRLDGEPLWRYDYMGLATRAAELASALQELGIKAGDIVSSLAWNTHRHLELFYGVPGLGAILHTANSRLSDDQIAYTINHAQSSVLFFDRKLLPLVERLSHRLINVRAFVMLSARWRSEGSALGATVYEEHLEAAEPLSAWPKFSENAGAFLCYTSGTTGNPKGVLYSHRSVVLHAIAAGLSGALGLSAFDCILPLPVALSRYGVGTALRRTHQWLQARLAERPDGRRQPARAHSS